MNQEDINSIKEITSEFFQKMSFEGGKIEAKVSIVRGGAVDVISPDVFGQMQEGVKEAKESVDLNIWLNEPQILIGQGGQTLSEIQKILRTILNKKLQKVFCLNLDINDYKRNKIDYLRDLAKDLADEVARTKEIKIMNPMPAYERRIIHIELEKRNDVITESRGQGEDRCVVIKPK
jgi:spoIIIJ-associated protein